jgi:hypothetical protein
MSDSNTKILQNPEIRALDNEKATLKIGDRVPVATGSFASSGGGGISPLVNTQFQYLDVGVNIDIVPHVHSEHEVTLKMVLEISSVTGSQNIGGISQPVIGQRRIEHETRLQDGDVNLVGGILEETETQSLSGYPWLTKIPILRYMFGQEDKEMRENEIVFAITPHIVRGQDLTEQNLRLVDTGTGSAVGIRHKDTRAAKAGDPSGEAATSNHNPVGPVKNTKPNSSTNSNNLVVPPTSVPQAQPALPLDPRTEKTSPLPSSQDQPAKSNDQKTLTSFTLPPFGPSPSSFEQPMSARMSDPITTQSGRHRSNRSSMAPQSSQALVDPCPYGQHMIRVRKKVVACTFN